MLGEQLIQGSVILSHAAIAQQSYQPQLSKLARNVALQRLGTLPLHVPIAAGKPNLWTVPVVERVSHSREDSTITLAPDACSTVMRLSLTAIHSPPP